MANFEWYRSFIAIYRSGTVSGAARARILTQPAVSQHLTSLEALLGKKLFVRTPKRMMPTEHGKELYNRIASSIDQLEQTSEEMLTSMNDSEEEILRLGTPFEYYYDQLIPRLHSNSFLLHISFGETSELIQRLQQDELDLVISTQNISASGVTFQFLEQERFLLIGPYDHPSMEIDKQDLGSIEKWLSAQIWLSYGVELPIIRRFWQEHFHKRPNLRLTHIVPSLHAILRMIEYGSGISVLPDYICKNSLREKRIKVLWDPHKELHNDLWVAYKRIDQYRVVIQKAISLFRFKGEK